MEKEKVSKNCSLRAVMVPFPDQGHLNPMLHLALRLASRGAMVAFVCIERNHDRLAEFCDAATANYHTNKLQHVDGLRFVAMPDHGLLPPDRRDVEASLQGPVFDPKLAVFDRGPLDVLQAADLESFIRSCNVDQGDVNNGGASVPRVSCLIADSFLPWTRDVARKCDVRWVVLWASSATWLCTSIYAAEDLELPEGPVACQSQELNMPGLPFFQDHAAAFFSTGFLRPHLTTHVEALQTADCVIVNTFDDLEKEALSALTLTCPVLRVGPLFYGLSESLKNELDAACFSWLDRQDRHLLCTLLSVARSSCKNSY